MQDIMEDLLVLDLSQIYQGPYCTLLLAYQGANVIKIEKPDGEVLRQRDNNKNPHEFVMFNSNKKGITLDLKSEEGKEIFLDMSKHADIIVENFTPGVMGNLGLDYETLKRINPSIIYASASGFGHDGPYSGFPGMDLTIQAVSGVMSTTGYADRPPVKAGPAFCDILGGIHLYGGIMSALYQRERTGKGQFLEVSMHDTIYPALASPLAAFYENDESVPERTDNRHSGLRVAPYNSYPAKDGDITIICVSERHWISLAKIMNKEELIYHPKYKNTVERSKNMKELDAIISKWTEDKNKWEIFSKLKKAHIPGAPVLSIAEVANDKHLKEREMILDIEHPINGSTKVPGIPIKFSDYKLKNVTPSPMIGEHNKQVLTEVLKLTEKEIEKLKNNRII